MGGLENFTAAADFNVPSDHATLSLLNGFSAEITTAHTKSLQSAIGVMPEGAEVFVASLPKDTPEKLITACREVKDAGFQPMPHIAARGIADRNAAENLLKSLKSDAGVDRALLIGGDIRNPAGEFESALDLLKTGLFEQLGFRAVGVGCYPEGHPHIREEALQKALYDKLSVIAEQSLSPFIISQFSFNSDAILSYIEKLRTSGVNAEFRIGLAGPAKRTTLIKYAMLCGVGRSLKAAAADKNLTRGALFNETPDRLLKELSKQASLHPELGAIRTHFFTFGGLPTTMDWLRKAQAEELFSVKGA